MRSGLHGMVVGAIILNAGASAAESGPAITGNLLATRPAAATGEAYPRCQATRKMAQYVTTGREKEIPALFAPGSIWLSPSGAEWRGPEGVAAGMNRAITAAADHPLAHVPFAVFGSGNDCFIELAIETAPGGSFRIASIIHITEDGAGKIAQAITYIRPKPMVSLPTTAPVGGPGPN